jgi:hypothetical protein
MTSLNSMVFFVEGVKYLKDRAIEMVNSIESYF